ncbi:MAG TPA: hypothetical protein VIY29_06385 [Ktedonobacteraceae bacterium]
MHVQVSLKMELAATASLTQMEQQIQEAGRQAMRERVGSILPVESEFSLQYE